ncbi:glycosyltransferase family 61 protein [Lichenicoccus sp.]|uniref:glycosyltransferase family 61 protein n=1 Tax=Lichenicoccus sp. TaxID=2781899 RepID=UPI003D0ECDB6
MPATEAPRLVEPDAASVLIRGRSPGFTTQPPDFVDGELIPPDVRLACAAWDRRAFAPRDIVVRTVRDVYVAEEGLVFTHDGDLLRHSVREHESEQIDRATRAVRRAIGGETIARHDLPLVLGKKRGASNYGHWMIELLPTLHLTLTRLADTRIGVLVHDIDDPDLGGIVMETLRRLGIADTRVRVSGSAPVHVRELIMVEGLTEHGSYMSPLVRDCHDRLAHGVAGSGVQRVFLSRGAGARRRFQDESHMGRLAEERGFTVVDTRSLGLDGQIGLLRDARLIAGVMGAAMTNLIYATAGARAALFAPATMPDTFFWFIANLRGLHYREIRCVQAGPGDGWERPLDIGFRTFRRVLDQEAAAL